MQAIKNSKEFVYGSRRSIIRRIAAILPDWLFTPPPRIVLHVAVKSFEPMSDFDNYESSFDKSDEDSSSCQMEENDEQWSLNLSSSKPDIVKTYSNIRIDGSERKFSELEQQLSELRLQVSQILSGLATVNGIKNIPDSVKEEPVDHTSIPPPPPAPPLPPPMPVTPIQTSRRIIKTTTSTPVPEVITMTDVLKEMEKVKLRPVKRSPGGRPIRDFPTLDVNHDLQAILKRRYSAMHAVSPSIQSNANHGSNDSFTES